MLNVILQVMGRILSRNEDRSDPGLDDEEGPSAVDQPPGEHDYGPGPSGLEQVSFF